MVLHFEDLDAPILQPHERDRSSPISFSVPIPTYDATDVPTHVHVIPGLSIIVVTAAGVFHAFSVEGRLLQTSQFQLPARTGSLACYSNVGGQGQDALYAVAGEMVVRVSDTRR